MMGRWLGHGMWRRMVFYFVLEFSSFQLVLFVVCLVWFGLKFLIVFGTDGGFLWRWQPYRRLNIQYMDYYFLKRVFCSRLHSYS